MMKLGFYAVAIEEGLISCVEEWDADGWVGGGRGISHRSPEPFDSVRVALDWAYAHAIEEFGSDGWVEHKEGLTVSGWQPIETAPKGGTRFLVHYPGQNRPDYIMIQWADDRSPTRFGQPHPKQYREETYDGGKTFHFVFCGECVPSYWHPLPAPPSLNHNER